VLTSSSAPPLFPGRRIDDHDYADGGINQNVPVAAAIAVGATNIYAVVAMALEQPPDERDFRTANLFDLHLRSSMILFADHQRANLAAVRPAGVDLTVIAPTVELVGPSR